MRFVTDAESAASPRVQSIQNAYEPPLNAPLRRCLRRRDPRGCRPARLFRRRWPRAISTGNIPDGSVRRGAANVVRLRPALPDGRYRGGDRYNAVAREVGLDPAQMALALVNSRRAFCHSPTSSARPRWSSDRHRLIDLFKLPRPRSRPGSTRSTSSSVQIPARVSGIAFRVGATALRSVRNDGGGARGTIFPKPLLHYRLASPPNCRQGSVHARGCSSLWKFPRRCRASEPTLHRGGLPGAPPDRAG